MENRRRRNQETISKYLCIIRAKLERQTSGVLNLEEMQNKPSSEPPMPDHMLALVRHEDNIETSKLLTPALSWLAETHGHLHYITRLASSDPARTRAWAAGETEDAQTEARMFEEAVQRLEQYVEWRAPGSRLNIAYDPTDEPAESRMAARDQERRKTAEDAYPILAEKVWRKMEASRSKTAAVHEVADAEDTSPARVWRALAFVDEESA